MKKIGLILIMVLSILIVTGCNNQKDDSVISFSWWGTSDRSVSTYKAIELFEKKYPEYKVEGDFTVWSGYQQSLSNKLSRGRESDVFQINYNWVYSMYGKDHFLDLNELNIDFSKYPVNEHKPLMIDNKILGLSQSETGYIFYLNKSVYDQAGASIPTTWQELIDAGNKIGALNSEKYAIGRLDAQQVAMLMFSYLSQITGKNVIEEDKLSFTQQELQQGFAFINVLRNNNVLIPSNATDTHNDGPSNPRWQQQENYGGVLTWNTAISEYENTLPNASEKLVMAGMFQQEANERLGMYKKVSMAYAVSKRVTQSETKQKAVEAFLEFMTTDPEAVKVLGVDRGVSNHTVTQSILANDETNSFKNTLEWKGHDIVQAYYNAQLEENIDLYIHPFYEHDTFRKIYESPIEKFLFGTVTAQQAASEIISRFDTELLKVING
ncbi:MAG: ABC transporter substrate-binding protein [Acholeplasma sp.]|nr:ABC transporter substrate-binding protein [Acholeplasma sp.]